MSERITKVNAMLLTETSRALRQSLDSPNVLATVTAVETAPDLKQATVWISTIPDDEDSWEIVAETRADLQQRLAGRIRLKHTPRLTLAHDHGQAHAGRIDVLLEDH